MKKTIAMLYTSSFVYTVEHKYLDGKHFDEFDDSLAIRLSNFQAMYRELS